MLSAGRSESFAHAPQSLAPAPTARARPVTSRSDAAFIALHTLTWLALAVQCVVDLRYENLVAAMLVLVSASVTFFYVRRTAAIREVPLSTAAVLGLCMTTQWGALVGQSVLWDSLTANLRVPLQTFGYLLGFQLVAIAAHWTSRRLTVFMSARRVASEWLLAPLGVFRIPSVPALWAFGCIGLLSILGSQVGQGNVLGKVVAAFNALAWAPFAILMLHARYGDGYCRLGRQIPVLAVFVAAAVLLGLALNFRVIMLTGALTAALLYLMILLDDERPFRLAQWRAAALLVIAVALLYQPLTYFFTGVQVAREQRDKISRMQMIQYTFEVLQDPAAIRREQDKARIASVAAAYDEYYFKSSMIGRLVETKFHDNSFYMVEGVSPLESRLIADDATDRILSILPYPVLYELGLQRAKYVTLYSVGDLLSNLRLGEELGGFRTGSMFAQGIAIFGVWTPFLYFLLCIAVFIVWDALSRSGSKGVPAVLSVIGMLLIYRVFAYGIVTDSIGNIAGVLLRFQVQNVLFYALVFAVSRVFWKPFDPGAPARAQRAGSVWG